MDAVAEAERAKYEHVWQRPEYRVKAHGLDLWQNRREIFPEHIESAVDLGCGHGRLFAQWCEEGIDAEAVDFAEAALDPTIRAKWGDRFTLGCLWSLDLDRVFDLGVCADVMEHIPEEKVGKVLRRIGVYCRTAVFLIANHPSKSLGFDLHPTMRPDWWWAEKLRGRFPVVEQLDYPSRRDVYLFRCEAP